LELLIQVLGCWSGRFIIQGERPMRAALEASPRPKTRRVAIGRRDVCQMAAIAVGP